MPAIDSVLGVSFSDTKMQVVEIEHRHPQNTVLAMNEYDNPFVPTNTSTVAGDLLGAIITDCRQAYNIRAKHVSVALDSSLLFVNTIPADGDLSEEELSEHLDWELSQFFPDRSPKDFVSDLTPLTQDTTTKTRSMLSVSVRKSLAETIHKSLASVGLRLHIVDVDHFSAETALRVNYPDTVGKYLALVGIKRNRLDVSLIRKGHVESYSYYLVESNDDIVERFGMLSRDTHGIFSIVAYGPHLENSLLLSIRRASSMLVEALNPLRHVNVSSSMTPAENLNVPSYRFASAIGVALRRD